MEAAIETLPKLTPTQALLQRAAALRGDGREVPSELPNPACPRERCSLNNRELAFLLLERTFAAAHCSRRGPGCGGGSGRRLAIGAHVRRNAGYVVTERKRPAPPEDLEAVETPDDLQLLEGIQGGQRQRTLSLIWLKNHEVPPSWEDQAALFGRMDR